MNSSTCKRRCRWLVVLRSGAGVCVRWKERRALKLHRESDPWGEPQWLRREGCQNVKRDKAKD